MFSLNDTMRYFLCPGRTDMRKGISSLCGLVHEKMKSEVKNGDVFIFIGSSRKAEKLPVYAYEYLEDPEDEMEFDPDIYDFLDY